MRLEISNQREVDIDLSWCIRKIAAVELTYEEAGIGEVVVSKRTRQPWENEDPAGLYGKPGRPKRGTKKKRKRRRVLHGKAIANIQAKMGRDPFDYTPEEIAQIEKYMSRELLRAIDIVNRTAQPQWYRMRRTMKSAADIAEMISRNKIKNRQLKPNAPKYLEKKMRMVDEGLAMTQYGTPPPPMVLTGRFIRGIKTRWKRGRRSSPAGVFVAVGGLVRRFA